MDEINQANGIVFSSLEDHGPSAIAKDHTGGAVCVIDDRGHYIGANHKDPLVRSGCNELRTSLHRINKCGARSG